MLSMMENIRILGKTSTIYHSSVLWKKNIEDICFKLLALLIILNHSVYYYIESTRSFIQIFVILVTLLTFIVGTKGKINITPHIKVGLVIPFIISIIYFISAVEISDFGSYATRYFIYIPLMIILLGTLNNEKEWKFFYSMSDIIYLIAIISICGWIFTAIFSDFPSLGWIPTEWGGIINGTEKGVINYYYIYYIAQESLVPGIKYRNCGIFCEGPAYSFILSIALLVEIFLRNKPDKKKIIILCIAMLTTFTTSSIVYFIIFSLLKCFISKRRTRRLKILVLPIFIIIFISTIVCLLEHKANQASVSIRLNSYINAFEAFKLNPIFGYGYKFNGAAVFNSGFTDSLSDTLIRGGIILTAYYLLPFLWYLVRAFRRMICKGGKIEKIYDQNFVVFIWAIYVFITNILTYTFIMLTFVAYGYMILTRKEQLDEKFNQITVCNNR